MSGNLETISAELGKIQGIMDEREKSNNRAFADMKEDILESKKDLNTKLDELKEDNDKQYADISKKVNEIRDTIIETRGGWKVLVSLVAFAGAVGALLAKIPWEKFFSRG